MSNSNDEWNRWRGEQTAILRLMSKELHSIGEKVESLEKQVYFLQGKAAAYGALSGAIMGILIAILRSLL